MAEGWARHLGGGRFQAQSAGIESHGKNLYTIALMQDAGVNISHQESRKLNDEILASANYLVTVCGHADEYCPVLPIGMRKEHWPLTDPASATGSEEEIMAVFKESCDDIRQRVADLIDRLETDHVMNNHE
jgi:arsenate reductase